MDDCSVFAVLNHAGYGRMSSGLARITHIAGAPVAG